MTTAEMIAQELGNDGMTWRTAAGQDFRQLCTAADGRGDDKVDRAQIVSTRWNFPDGSAIVAAGEGWAFGFDAPVTCHCWPDVDPNHAADCAERG